MRLLPDSEEVVMLNVIRTKKSAKKQNVLAADDNFRRARAISALLMEVLTKYDPKAIAAEAMSFPRNAGNAAKMAISWGILACLVEERQLPLVQASPQQIKATVCPDQKTATKEDIQNALLDRYGPEGFRAFQESTPEGQWEHAFDSVGVVVTCLGSNVMRMARGMAG
jgi:Holliday junction resolvasome RuvABC endonuclease subunit